MQPNEQNQNQPTGSMPPPSPTPSVDLEQQPVNPYAQPAPSSIPEYLHMDPIPSPETHGQGKGRLKKVVLIVLALTVLGAIGFFAWSWFSKESERQFTKVLDGLMQTRYLSQDITSVNSTAGTLSVTAETDYSTPGHPKSKFTYHYQRAGATTDTMQGEEIISNSTTAARLHTTSDSTAVLDTWRKLTGGKDSTQYDPVGLSNVFSRNIRQLGLIGDFSESQRQQLTQVISDGGMYKIDKTHTEEITGKKYTVYNVTTDYKKLESLTSKMNELLSINETAPTAYETSTTEFWVDQSSGKLAKTIEEVHRNKDSPVTKVTTTYSYPTGLSIDLPPGL
jgi:hypothetical protein